MPSQWYVSINGESQGPFADAQLRELVSTGRLGPSDLVWRDGMAEWVGAGKIKGLFPGGATPPPPPMTPRPAAPAAPVGVTVAPLAMTVVGDGKFAFTGDYAQIFQLVERALRECDTTVKERSADKGLIRGKCKYGLNPFGITITATFYDASPSTRVDVEATLTDAFDTFGACKKKVAQISERIVEIASSGIRAPMSAAVQPEASFDFLGGAQAAESPGGFAFNPAGSTSRPPSYTQRAGVSYRGKAMTGFWLSIGGIFVGPVAIAGLIMSSVALNGMSTSTNQEGKGLAIAGAVIGLIATIGWILLVMSRL
jgi:hypothetical protein